MIEDHGLPTKVVTNESDADRVARARLALAAVLLRQDPRVQAVYSGWLERMASADTPCPMRTWIT
jgi:hypothetical protein